MSRDFYVAGPTLVSIRGGAHWASGFIGRVSQLGLAQEAIKIEIKTNHRNLGSDSIGNNGTVDVMVNTNECEISMRLVHFDPLVLSCCVADSMGGVPVAQASTPPFTFDALEDKFIVNGYKQTKGGQLLGNGLPRFASGNYYLGLYVQPAIDSNERDWRFFHTYLSQNPVTHKMGAEASVVDLKWRAVRYVPMWQASETEETFAAIEAANASTNHGPRWVEQSASFPNEKGLLVEHRLAKEIQTNLYSIPLWDHDADADVIG